MEQPCREAVEKIEDGRQHQQPEGQMQVAVGEYRHRRYHPAEQIREREQVGNGKELDLHIRARQLMD